MPAKSINEIKVSQIGADVIIKEDDLKLLLQHAFIAGVNFTNGETEKAGWDYAVEIKKQITKEGF